MNIYHADYDEFFSIKTDPKIHDRWLINSKLCEEPIAQLIDRYDIRSKRILSIGPSYGHEEYWFYKKGLCSLTFVDIDENHTIENHLKAISLGGERSTDGLLTYAIGDARDFPTNIGHKFDVCYFSSFTPDMLKNREVAARFSKSMIKKAFGRLSRKSDDVYSGGAWPEGEEPFSTLTSTILRDALKNDGGLLIYQSYASNVDARMPGYVSAIRRSLLSLGIFLMDSYYYIGYPSVHLFAGFKGSETALADYLRNTRNNRELSRIHGRSQVEFRGIKKIYDVRVET